MFLSKGTHTGGIFADGIESGIKRAKEILTGLNVTGVAPMLKSIEDAQQKLKKLRSDRRWALLYAFKKLPWFLAIAIMKSVGGTLYFKFYVASKMVSALIYLQKGVHTWVIYSVLN